MVFSQQTEIDSLKGALKKVENPKEKLEILKKLTDKIMLNHGFVADGKVNYFTELKKLAKDLDDKNAQATYFRYTSEDFMRKNIKDSAIFYAEKSLNLTPKDKQNYLSSINQLGRVYHHFLEYKKAIKTYILGLEKTKNNTKGINHIIGQIYLNLSASYRMLNEKHRETEATLKGIQFYSKSKNYEQVAYIYYSIAYQYMSNTNYEKAEKYYLKSLKMTDSLNLSNFNRSSNYHGLGLNYSRWGKYKKAEEYNLKALKLFKKQKDQVYTFDVLNNMAVLYSKMKQYEKAEEYALKALTKAKEIKHPLAISGALQVLSFIYIKWKKYNNAEKYLNKIAKDTANTTIMSLDKIATFYKNCSIINEHKGNLKKALKDYKRYTKLYDSIQEMNLDSKFTELESKYQTEKKEKENLQLKHEKAEQKLQLNQEQKQKWLFGSAFLLSLITLGIFGYYYRRNQQQKRLIESLQKELHHRVKNNLAIINRFVEVLKEEFNEPKFTEKLTELQNRISSINEVHQQLYDSKNVTNLNMKNYIDKLVSNVSDSFPNHQIETSQKVSNNLHLTSTKAFPLGIIINEFLTNSYKYAFNDNKGNIDIEMQETGNHYELLLKDNGKGFPKNFDIKTDTNFGLRIVKLLCQQIDAKFDLKTNNGVELKLIIAN